MRFLFALQDFPHQKSYDIIDENTGNSIYTVSKNSYDERTVYSSDGAELGKIKSKLFNGKLKLELYCGEDCLGFIDKGYGSFSPLFTLNCGGLEAIGDFFEWEYFITEFGRPAARVAKEYDETTCFCRIDITYPQNAVKFIMLIFAIASILYEK